jgi:hypothetical protein
MWQDHPELENIELYETSWESSAEVKNAFSQFRNVISLRICPDSEVGLKNVNKILKNINAIVSLHVDLRTFRLPPQKDDNLVPTKLFQHAISASSKLNPNTHWKLSLTHLALWNVGLAPSSCDLWIHVLDLASLQVLELSHCDYVENFLAAMANDTREGQLQSLTINHRSPSDVDGHVFCNALEQYLEKASPLTKLVLRIGNLLRLPSWQHIALHGPELETLLLDLDGANNYSGDEMIKILECMTPKLRQLGFVEGETTDIKQIFKLCNPVTLYLLGASKAASSLNSHSTASDLDGIQYVFRRSAQGIFEAAERGYHAQMISDGLPFRLRVVALARYACQSTVENMLCYVKGEETFLRKKKQAMFGVELRDLTKCLEEVDILIGEPMIFGPGGRN